MRKDRITSVTDQRGLFGGAGIWLQVSSCRSQNSATDMRSAATRSHGFLTNRTRESPRSTFSASSMLVGLRGAWCVMGWHATAVRTQGGRDVVALERVAAGRPEAAAACARKEAVDAPCRAHRALSASAYTRIAGGVETTYEVRSPSLPSAGCLMRGMRGTAQSARYRKHEAYVMMAPMIVSVS